MASSSESKSLLPPVLAQDKKTAKTRLKSKGCLFRIFVSFYFAANDPALRKRSVMYRFAVPHYFLYK
jgi:hypothetical protein